MVAERKDHVFKDLAAEDPEQHPVEIESYCVNCGENGVTRMLLTKIPHYKEIILMSFTCEQCGFENNEIQPGGKIQVQGVQFRFRVQTERDLSRQVVRSDYATIIVPKIDLEIPHDSHKGEVTTIEGILRRTISGLMQDQPVRRALHPEDAEKIDAYVKRIEDLLELKEPFSIELSDPSGNSFIENIHAPRADPALEIAYFNRSREQDHLVGLFNDLEIQEEEGAVAGEGESKTDPECTPGNTTVAVDEGNVDRKEDGKVQDRSETVDLQNEVLSFPTNCPDCNAPAATNMKVTSIPHFKEVVIMATVCDFCGHKTNEVKSGGGIEAKGKRITLTVTDQSDLSRDVLKSETCSLRIPELELEMGSHTLGGKFTTLEGLLRNALEQIDQNPLFGGGLAVGDSATDEAKGRLENFKKELRFMIEGEKLPFTVVLDDPAGNSYLQNVYAPEDDPEMKIEHYERNFEQNEELGLNDMKVEGYETDVAS